MDPYQSSASYFFVSDVTVSTNSNSNPITTTSSFPIFLIGPIIVGVLVIILVPLIICQARARRRRILQQQAATQARMKEMMANNQSYMNQQQQPSGMDMYNNNSMAYGQSNMGFGMQAQPQPMAFGMQPQPMYQDPSQTMYGMQSGVQPMYGNGIYQNQGFGVQGGVQGFGNPQPYSIQPQTVIVQGGTY